MKTIEKGLEEAYIKAGENAYFGNGFVAGVEFAERWIPMNELKEAGVEYLFKTSNGKHSVGKFEFIENKLCITTDISYSLVEDSGFTHFRPITHK
jgi:hypothetical protein